ncbi:MAG TPA: pilus assembly protein TadG-related protein [Micromonosporaceae bacterium]|nr:pilus assembly protein TadG-related protein [Micromonosporaceae bacterium]
MIVGVLLAGGVLLGMTALAVDVGLLYAEREELQSGADAAAMAVALDCARRRPACSTAGVRTTAERLATENARDGFADALTVCGRDGRGPLTRCPSAGGTNLVDCLGVRSTAGTNYVEVRTTTQTDDGTLLPPAFAHAVVPGYEGTTVGACARVAWGVPRAAGLGVTISACEWRGATADGTRYAPAPPAVVRESDGFEQVLLLRDPRTGGSCPGGPAGWDRPGVFGWLDVNGLCRLTTVPDWYWGDAGSPSLTCRNALSAAVGRITMIPVYDVTFGNGVNTLYRLYGIAAFVVTGFRVPGRTADSTVTGDPPCGTGESCVSGYFVEAVLDWTDDVDDGLPPLGAVAVKTIA